MNTPFLDSNGNPMEKGYFYSITVNHGNHGNRVFPKIQYLSRKTGTMMMRFRIIDDPDPLFIRYIPNNRPKLVSSGEINITDNEDDSDDDFGGGKSKKNTIKRRKRVSNKRRKSNKKKKRRSIKRRK
jgi:hypothetical protein